MFDIEYTCMAAISNNRLLPHDRLEFIWQKIKDNDSLKDWEIQEIMFQYFHKLPTCRFQFPKIDEA